MGNSSTKESRGPDSPASLRRPGSPGGGTSGPTSSTEGHQANTNTRTGATSSSRPDLSFLGLRSSSNTASSAVPERRETKQEREARKLEKERVARLKERERSIKEEHVDGGYLVTMGVYTGTEDFNKPIVRQLMIERRIAPFWRGLDDFKEEWTEHQLVAAGRGLPIPAADEIPQEELTRPLPESTHASSQNIQNLMVPISGRSHSAASENSATTSPSHTGFGLSSPTTATSPTHSSSPFRPRSKTLASLTTSSKNTSTEMVPREIQLPKDPFVNRQAIEVFLYKDSTECPICFIYYPPYLNTTRCCGQPICSECFVQIKRPDPHPPEHEHNDPSNPAPPTPQDTAPESLVSEPATCPYCQQAEFGVTYDNPPFRRGLAYANSNGIDSFSPAMSSSSSLNSTNNPTAGAHTHKRRLTSLSANSTNVITTDKIRPDWALKLANARNHLARRSAAATALHTAAYLIGNGSTDTRSFGFSGRNRFGRHRGEASSPGQSGTATPSPTAMEPQSRAVSEQIAQMRREAAENGGQRRRSRMDDLEDMMMMEAIRLSLAAEEERKRRTEKEAAKEAKKRAKEEKKKETRERKGVYGSGASSASGSALSLSLPGLGRRRGNSGGSNLAREVMPEASETPPSKGKGVDRPKITSAPATASAPIDFARPSSSSHSGIPGARHLDTNTLSNIENLHQPSPSPTAPEKPSHLRQMSNASSPASSFMESIPGSLRNDFHGHGSSSSLDTHNASGTNIAGHTGNTPDSGGEASGTESMFNFQSLAAMIGDDDEDKEDAAKHIEHLNGGESSADHAEGSTSLLAESIATLKVDDQLTNGAAAAAQASESKQQTLLEPQRTTPEVMVTPVTPAADTQNEDAGKQLGANWTEQVAREITQ